MTLKQIGQKNRTDKADHVHSFNGKTYLDWYEKYFQEYKDLPANILEIGVRDACSLKTWEEFFPNAKIFGIDIEDKKKHDNERIKTFCGDQSDTLFINSVISQTGPLDIVIDDGSHINHITLKSFELLFPALKPGGLYIIEDLLCSYKENIREDAVQWPGMDKVMDLGHEMINNRRLIDDFITKLIYDMDHKMGQIEFIAHHSMFLVIKKV